MYMIWGLRAFALICKSFFIFLFLNLLIYLFFEVKHCSASEDLVDLGKY